MSKKAKIIIAVLCVLLGAALVVVAWLWLGNDKKKDEVQNQETAINQPAADSTATTPNEVGTLPPADQTTSFPTAEQRDTIKAVMDTMNTQPIAGYMAPSVEVILAASEGQPAKNPDQAALSLEYFQDATRPWRFDLPADTLKAYGKSQYYGQYFDENTYVGRAESGEVVSFHFNSDGKIDRIFMAINDELF